MPVTIRFELDVLLSERKGCMRHGLFFFYRNPPSEGVTNILKGLVRGEAEAPKHVSFRVQKKQSANSSTRFISFPVLCGEERQY